MPWNLFGAKETKEEIEKRDKEMIRQWQRNLKSEQRKIERDIRKVQMEEDKVKREIKNLAKKGEVNSVKILVKQVCRSKKAVERLYTSKAQLNSVLMEITNMAATMKLADTLKKSSSIMSHMNQLINVPEIQQTMAQMQKEMLKAGLIDETIGDAMDALDPDAEDEAEDEVQKVLEELAIEGLQDLFPAPKGKIPTNKEPAAKVSEQKTATSKEEDDLLARLNAL